MSDDPGSPVASKAYVEEAIRLVQSARPHYSAEARAVITGAQDEARALDDNHCGTEHVVLALWSHAPRDASVEALAAVGVTRDVFAAQLHFEEGRSPEGPIPYTPRAMMIGGLAYEESTRLGSPSVEPAHILLGALREAERWAAEKSGGPQHLRAALSAVGISADRLEDELMARL